MATPDFITKAGRDALNHGVDRIVKEHSMTKTPLSAEDMDFEVRALLSLFNRSEIAHLFIIAVNRLAGHDTNV